MKPYMIRYWRMPTPDRDLTFIRRVESFCKKVNGDWYFYGDINEWIQKWQFPFLFDPPNDGEKQYIQGVIFVNNTGFWG